jgi:hypothetical protein
MLASTSGPVNPVLGTAGLEWNQRIWFFFLFFLSPD